MLDSPPQPGLPEPADIAGRAPDLRTVSPEPAPTGPAADPAWFREPTSREHAIAAGLFVSFGLFFIILFVVLRGWWFGWIILGLGGISVLHGLWHAVESRPGPPSDMS